MKSWTKYSSIAGHHGGLSNWRGDRASALDPNWRRELGPQAVGLFPASFKWHEDKSRAPFQLAMLGRMAFSCLVDADHRDTEKFYAEAGGDMVDREWPKLATIIDDLTARFNAHMADIADRAGDSPLGRLRADILGHARGKATLPRGVFTLDVPTGGGKTLASLGFALDHAKAHRMDRVIYAIPFTSIIDQTAAIFRDVLGEDHVLEHHSAIDDERQHHKLPEQEGERRYARQDAPRHGGLGGAGRYNYVQLFESLFANRPSRCRKLHNLVNAVIILDSNEKAGTMPGPFIHFG